MFMESLLNQTTFKVLYCIDELNKDGYAPNSVGVYKVLVGVEDDECSIFSSLSSWRTLISYSQKRITQFTNALIKCDYIEKKLSSENGEYYFVLTDKGEMALKDYKSKSRIRFKKRSKYVKSNFTKIEKIV